MSSPKNKNTIEKHNPEGKNTDLKGKKKCVSHSTNWIDYGSCKKQLHLQNLSSTPKYCKRHNILMLKCFM